MRILCLLLSLALGCRTVTYEVQMKDPAQAVVSSGTLALTAGAAHASSPDLTLSRGPDGTYAEGYELVSPEGSFVSGSPPSIGATSIGATYVLTLTQTTRQTLNGYEVTRTSAIVSVQTAKSNVKRIVRIEKPEYWYALMYSVLGSFFLLAGASAASRDDKKKNAPYVLALGVGLSIPAVWTLALPSRSEVWWEGR